MNDKSPHKEILFCFDLGGVLVQTHQSLEALCATHQLPILPELFAKTKVSRKILKSAYHRGEYDIRTYSKKLGGILENRYTSTQMLTLHKAEIIGAFNDAKTTHLFETLRQKGHTVAILSNTCEIHWQEIVTKYWFPRKTDHLFLSFDLSENKPRQTFYEIVENVTTHEPKNILFFDDSRDNVIAAEQRGWNAYQIVQGSPPLEQIDTVLKRHEIFI